MVVPPGANARYRLVPAPANQNGVLSMLYREIGCQTVERVHLRGWPSVPGLDMWADEEGLFVADPEPNLRAMSTILTLRRQLGQVIVGTCVFMLDDGRLNVVGLSADQAALVWRTAQRNVRLIENHLRKNEKE